MKSRFVYTFLFISFLLYLSSCKTVTAPEDSTNPGSAGAGSITLTGQVVDKNSGNPVANAVVRFIGASEESQAITDASGSYTATVKLDKSVELNLIALKEGYYSDTTKVFATSGRNVEVPLFELKPLPTGGSVSSGSAASVFVASQSGASIGVKESGSEETLNLIWEVRDSSGTPLDAAHAVTVNFRIGVAPNGGEFITPLSAKTNALGRINLSLTSGTRAGVVQIIAEISTPKKTITSKPVSITINGGLPDQAHFSIAPSKLNVPGLITFGILDPINVYAGDKYSNPVKPGTAVYFSTTGGIIEASGITDTKGLATVNLITAEPKPQDPVLGKGFATITASSADENYKIVSASTIVLFSGAPNLSVTPTTVDIPHLGTQTFNYTLKDENGNPLSEGTSVTVVVDGDKVKSTGDVAVSLPDTQDKAWTQFSFSVTSIDSTNTVRPVSITIKTEGPNGKKSLDISGTAK